MPAVVSPPGTGEELRAGPTFNRVRVPGSSTGGRLGAVEMRLEAGWEGPPPHVHREVTHLWYVLEGEVTFWIDGDGAFYPTGSCLFVPAGVAHGFGTPDSAGAVVLQVDTPRPLDAYFRDLAEAFPPGVPAEPSRIAAIMARHDTAPVS